MSREPREVVTYLPPGGTFRKADYPWLTALRVTFADEPGSRLLVPSAMPDAIAVAVGSAVPDAHALLELYGDVEDDRDDTGGSTP